MKTKLNLLLIALMVVAFTACKEDDDSLSLDEIPGELRTDFLERHPNSSAVEWEQEGQYWEAEFVENGVEVGIIYDLEFNWIRTEREISVNDLPAAAVAYVTANFPNGSIDEAESFEAADGTSGYVAEVVDGGKEYEIDFDEEGNFLSQTEETDDDD